MSVAIPETSLPAERRKLPLFGPTPGVARAQPPKSVRISVTDRCDFACTYCRPHRNDGYYEGKLVPHEWRTLVDGLLDAGVTRFRLTGGEPLLHPGIVEIVSYLAARGAQDLALTTNASQLGRLARPLRDAGLQRINISIDTLDRHRFAAMTRGGDLAKVLSGIDAAQNAGLSPIKLNTVVLRGENDDEIESLMLWAWSRRMVPRFLEVMGIGEGAKLVGTKLVPVTEMQRKLAAHVASGQAEVEPGKGPAKYLASRSDSTLRVGFISGTSDTFCGTCDRLRVSSTGVLRPCLATNDGVDARDAAQSGDSASVVDKIAEAWAKKPDGTIWKGCTEKTAETVSIRAIGG